VSPTNCNVAEHVVHGIQESPRDKKKGTDKGAKRTQKKKDQNSSMPCAARGSKDRGSATAYFARVRSLAAHQGQQRGGGARGSRKKQRPFLQHQESQRGCLTPKHGEGGAPAVKGNGRELPTGWRSGTGNQRT